MHQQSVKLDNYRVSAGLTSYDPEIQDEGLLCYNPTCDINCSNHDSLASLLSEFATEYCAPGAWETRMKERLEQSSFVSFVIFENK